MDPVTIMAIASIVMSAVTAATQYAGSEKTAKNSTRINAVYDKAIQYYDNAVQGHTVTANELTNLINQLQSVQMLMTGKPRAIVSNALQKAQRQLSGTQRKITQATRDMNTVQNEKYRKAENENAHAASALFRKERSEENIRDELMGPEAKKAIDAVRANSSLINPTQLDVKDSGNQNNNYIGGNNIEKTVQQK